MISALSTSELNDVVLGLDVGAQSIGWALLDETNHRVIASGVRVFPEGVDRDPQGGEKSRSQGRREARMLRRQIQRRAGRLRVLRGALAEAGLLPADQEAQLKLLAALPPYELRGRALDGRLEPFELGRVFYHLGKRRGYLSNRKTDRARTSDSGAVLKGITELAAAMQGQSHRTLGEHFARLLGSGGRVRNSPGVYAHSGERKMYEHEFEAVWQAQTSHHPGLLTDVVKFGSLGKQAYPQNPRELGYRGVETHLQRYGLHGIIFFQRRVYWPASVVGRCELEPREKRCPRADRLAQRFRILQDVNNLRYRSGYGAEERQLSDQQRQALLDFLGSHRDRTFDQIRTHLKKSALPEDARFNFERQEKGKLKGNETDAVLGGKNCLGKKWKSLDEFDRDRIVAVLLDERLSDDETEYRLVTDCGLSPEEAKAAADAHLPDSYMSFSRLAIAKLAPFLERGMPLRGKTSEDSALHAAGYLGESARSLSNVRLGPVPSRITNPIVRQALFEVRKVVNAVIERYGCPSRIRVELAREAKKSAADRLELLKQNNARNRERKAAENALIEGGLILQPRRKDVQKYLLWQEAECRCVYCGQMIGQAQLASGEADVDHILPRWRSLDDSYMNKVLVHRRCNSDKANRTPREWLETSEPERYRQMLDRAQRLPWSKLNRFTRRDIQLEDFIPRQLTDTAYISTQVREYLQQLGVDVSCSGGTITAELRRYWGLNTLLGDDGAKNRADHRHHAVDAAVVALATAPRIHNLANAKGGQVEKEVAPPWDGFRDALAVSIAAINVSNKPRRRISGALHQETFYGATQKAVEAERVEPGSASRPWAKGWQEGEKLFVRRKAVSAIQNGKHLVSVRDAALRDVLTEHLRRRGVDPEGKYPKGIFEGENAPSMPSGVPIRNVRLAETLTTARPAGEQRQFQFVQPGSNHHICYYESGAPDRLCWKAQVITMWDAALRVRRDGGSPVDRLDSELGRFVMSLSIGESFMVSDGSGGERLCVMRKVRQLDGLLYYKLHLDARAAAELTPENLYFSPEKMRQLGARKVTVDPLGVIRPARD